MPLSYLNVLFKQYQYYVWSTQKRCATCKYMLRSLALFCALHSEYMFNFIFNYICSNKATKVQFFFLYISYWFLIKKSELALLNSRTCSCCSASTDVFTHQSHRNSGCLDWRRMAKSQIVYSLLRKTNDCELHVTYLL